MLNIEMKKLKLRRLLLTILIIPLLANIFGVINYKGNIDVLTNEWQSLWTQVSLFYFMFFLIPLIGIVVSSLWSIEHKAGLKLIRTSPKKNINFVVTKAFITFVIVAIAQLYFLGLFIFFGKIVCNLPTTNFTLFFYYVGFSIILSVPIIFIMSALSIKIKSLSIVVLISVGISILGFMLCAQNIFPLLNNIIAISKLALKMNNFSYMYIDEVFYILLIGIIEIIVFLKMSRKFLKYEG